jgi:hypothetical protein
MPGAGGADGEGPTYGGKGVERDVDTKITAGREE